MLHRVAPSLLLGLLSLLLPVLPARAEPADGWEELESVPAWVTDPPAREGWIRAVDVGQSNRLDLAYGSDRVLRERLNLRWRIEKSLRPVLGEAARAPAIAGAKAATVVRKGFHLKRAERPQTVGGQVYSVFVLWETPLSVVLGAIPEVQHDASLVALRAEHPVPAWAEVEADPSWVESPPEQKGMFVAVASETSDRPDVARAVADLRAHDHVRFEIQGRLRFQVGNHVAYEAAEHAVSHGVVLERAWRASSGRAWMLWAVPVERILANVPEASQEEVARVLGEPIPPAAWTWQSVDAEPGWVKRPPRWPGHLPYVQTVASEHPDVARQQSIRSAEREVREHLEGLLQPVVGFAAAAEAARAGANRRDQGAHAIYERRAGAGTARAEGTRLVTAWALWQIPIDTVLEALDPKHHAAARAALRP